MENALYYAVVALAILTPLGALAVYLLLSHASRGDLPESFMKFYEKRKPEARDQDPVTFARNGVVGVNRHLRTMLVVVLIMAFANTLLTISSLFLETKTYAFLPWVPALCWGAELLLLAMYLGVRSIRNVFADYLEFVSRNNDIAVK
ncbi:MAG: hypothetical protein V1748_13145 [Actinomycetota bacterium]